MKLLTTKVHGIIDYTQGIGMILSLCVFDFNWNEKIILIIAGIITLLYSIATNYEIGFTALLTVKQHLRMDVISGVIMCLLPLTGLVDFISFIEVCGVTKIALGIVTSSSLHKDPYQYQYKRYDVPMYGKFEKFPSIKWE